MSEKRQSGIELLRIIAMFMILAQHANGLGIGLPGAYECNVEPVNSFFRLLIQCFVFVGVDVFVLISGWFGINFKVKRLGEYLFQCLFFSLVVTLVLWLVCGRPEMGIKSWVGVVLLGKSYWFVKSYLLLYVLSPVLNRFIDTVDKKEAGLVLGLFLAIMLVFGWTDAMPEFNFGSSCISFIGLYLFARYLRKYCQKICSKPIWQYIAGYFLPLILLAVTCFVLYRVNAPTEISRCIFSFVNPLVIIGAVSLVLMFSRMDFASAFVNKVAKSSFSVYLFHCGPVIWGLFLTVCGSIYQKYHGVGMISLMLAFLIAVFAVACIIDQLRLYCSSLIFERDRNE